METYFCQTQILDSGNGPGSTTVDSKVSGFPSFQPRIFWFYESFFQTDSIFFPANSCQPGELQSVTGWMERFLTFLHTTWTWISMSPAITMMPGGEKSYGKPKNNKFRLSQGHSDCPVPFRIDQSGYPGAVSWFQQSRILPSGNRRTIDPSRW